MARQTVVLDVAGQHWATSGRVIQQRLDREPGVLNVEPNAIAQTVTVAYDPTVTTVAALTARVRECGYHCAGQSVPDHLCDPAAEPGHPGEPHQSHGQHHGSHPGHPTTTAPSGHHDDRRHEGHREHADHGDPAGDATLTSHEAMGHGGHHAG